MPRSLALLLTLATLSASAQAVPENSYATQPQAAPIERVPLKRYRARTAEPVVTRPAQGVLVRSTPNGAITTVSSDAKRTELRIDRGIANISVHDPAHDSILLVDLPGGQTQLLKNGFYTFNAQSNTVRVLKGEASAFPGQATNPIKVKEDHQLSFTGSAIRSVEVDPAQARADLLPGSYAEPRYREAYYGGDYGYGEPYPYYAFGYYPYGYGYPYYGVGYPFGFGIGFGYYGGFGGYRGGFRGFRR